MIKSLKRIFICTLLILAAAFLLLQIDDPLTPEAENMLHLGSAVQGNEGYAYMTGIGTPVNEDPLSYGLELAPRLWQQAEAAWTGTGPNDFASAPQELIKPDQTDICQPFSRQAQNIISTTNPDYQPLSSTIGDCLQYYFNTPLEVSSLLNTYSTLLERHRTYLAMEDFDSPRQFLYGPNLAFSYLIQGTRLSLLENIQLVQQGNSELAETRTIALIDQLRKQQVILDDNLGYALNLTSLMEAVDVLFIIARHENNSQIHLATLTMEERGAERLIARYFTDQIADLFSPYQNDYALYLKTDVPHWLLNTLLKENMLTNAFAAEFESIVKVSRLTHEKFAAGYGSFNRPEYRPSPIRNFLGSGVMKQRYRDSASPYFSDYYYRNFDLDNKITLFNKLIDVEEIDEAVKNIPNPYYPGTETAYLTEDGKYACFDGPDSEKERPDRCLRVRL